MTTITDYINEKLLCEFKKAFSLLDKDGDGRITAEDIGAYYKSLGLNPSDEELQHIVSEADCDGDGALDFSEYLATVIRKIRRPEDLERRIQQTFRLLDKDGNGFLSKTEIRNMTVALGKEYTDEELNEGMRNIDTDGNGRISYEDYLQLMTRHFAWLSGYRQTTA